MSRLTIQQAEAEAKWRWGNLLVRGFARFDGTLKRPFQVGTIIFKTVTIRGQGASWEGAFSDAASQTNAEPCPTSPVAQKSAGPSRPSPVAGQITTTLGPEARQRA